MYWSTDEHPDQRGDVWWRMTCRLQMLRRGRRRGVADYIIPGTCFSNKYISKTSAVGSPGWTVDTPLCKLRDALWMPTFFVKDLGRQHQKRVPTNHRPSKRSIKVRHLPFPVNRSPRWTTGSPRMLLVLFREFESRRGEIWIYLQK